MRAGRGRRWALGTSALLGAATLVSTAAPAQAYPYPYPPRVAVRLSCGGGAAQLVWDDPVPEIYKPRVLYYVVTVIPQAVGTRAASARRITVRSAPGRRVTNRVTGLTRSRRYFFYLEQVVPNTDWPGIGTLSIQVATTPTCTA